MNPTITNWQVTPGVFHDNLVKLTADNLHTLFMTPDQARKIADALYRVANGIDLTVNCKVETG